MRYDMDRLLADASQRATRYLEALRERTVFPSAEAIKGLGAFDIPLPQTGLAPEMVLGELDDRASPATVASAGPRYFGFVTGGAVPASLAANWLAGAWDQNAFSDTSSPAASAIEAVACRWLLEILELPATAGTALVTGTTMANFTCLAAARGAQLAKLGWDVEADGLFGAPALKVVVGEESHAAVFKALGLLGLGRNRVRTVPTDPQGRLRADALGELSERTIVCLQAGNVNTGAFDPVGEISSRARDAGAWVHVDGAFGLWVRALPQATPSLDGLERAHSWATDAHKWLNVPYDCGVAIVDDADALRRAVAISAAYLPADPGRQPINFTPESSRRARGVEVWAALRSLGREGVADLIERNCRYARQVALALQNAGYEVLNDVCLNQVLAAFGDDATTQRVIARVQEDGTCWCGSTQWHGRTAMRISVSSWATTEADIERVATRITELAALERSARK